MKVKHYLDDLFPKGRNSAQVPFLYGQSHNDLLNELFAAATRSVDAIGIYYEIFRFNDPKHRIVHLQRHSFTD